MNLVRVGCVIKNQSWKRVWIRVCRARLNPPLFLELGGERCNPPTHPPSHELVQPTSQNTFLILPEGSFNYYSPRRPAAEIQRIRSRSVRFLPFEHSVITDPPLAGLGSNSCSGRTEFFSVPGLMCVGDRAVEIRDKLANATTPTRR